MFGNNNKTFSLKDNETKDLKKHFKSIIRFVRPVKADLITDENLN